MSPYMKQFGSTCVGENSASTVYTPKQILRNQDNLIREEIFKRDVQLLKIDTAEQLGDIFTKSLTRFVFEYLRKNIMWW